MATNTEEFRPRGIPVHMFQAPCCLKELHGVVEHFIEKKMADNTQFDRPVGTCTRFAQVHALPSQCVIMCSNLWDLGLDLNNGNINLVVAS